ncbi:hypothetical protein AOQ84DRAFT_225656 [Glonium stellatum]|uniref:Uncharacterized protein n=1 Tax=Glonium stellatum TaxID=574774 RepID=A0A8E2ETT8_9PEZI|nr:hypothetical protein AOQ84DRAFT_225656 [Glonium stellatum]
MEHQDNLFLTRTSTDSINADFYIQDDSQNLPNPGVQPVERGGLQLLQAAYQSPRAFLMSTEGSDFSHTKLPTLSLAISDERRLRPDTRLKFPSDSFTPNLLLKRSLFRSWAFEIGAVLLSISSTIATIAVLRYEDGKPLTAWAFPTSLNTVISALGAISRVSLAFAVSACIGQQKWNWLRRQSDRFEAFEMFDEASRGPWGSTRLLLWLKVRLDSVAFGYVAAIGQAKHLDVGKIIFDSADGRGFGMTSAGLIELQPSSARVDFGVASAIYNGFSESNCLKKGTNIYLPDNVEFDGNFTIFTLPYANISNYNAMDLSSYTTMMATNTTTNPLQTISFQDVETLLMGFVMIKAAERWLHGGISWELSTPVVTECALYLCINAYQSSVQSGKLKEDVPLVDAPPAAIQDLYASAKNVLYTDEDVFRTDLQLEIPQEQSRDLSVDVIQQFKVTQETVASTVDFLLGLTYSRKQMAYNPDGFNVAAPLIMDVLWNSTNLTTTFENVAQSMTNQIRNTASTLQAGTLQRWVIHIQAKWAFLAFQIVLLSTGCLYVILTILETNRLRLPAWKEAAMPTLMYGFDNETQRLLKEAQTNARASNVVQTVLIRFDENEARWRVVST